MAMTTIDHFLIEQQTAHEGARGELSQLLSDIVTGAKIVAGKVRRAGLIDILGAHGVDNTSGDHVQKLDMLAHDVFVSIFAKTGRFAAYTSEESDEVMLSPKDGGSYIVHIDPLDGSSNIDVNVSVGTIFSIYRRVAGGPVDDAEILRPGKEQVAAGYVLYGSSMVLVYTTGQGVHEFTFDPDIGEFFLSNESMRFPEQALYYTINESNRGRWSDARVAAVVDEFREQLTSRYVGSFVADFHRNLLKGGIFMYPGDNKNLKGKLRLMYEANPMALLAQQAGGSASDGVQDILDIQPEAIHQRTPLFIGSKELVERATLA